jgi:putative ABC transport system permease protein
VLDVPKDEIDGLTRVVRGVVPDAAFESAPMLRGRIVKLKDKAPEEMKVAPEAQWVLAGDRGLTYAEEIPAGSRLVKGEWWSKDYAGEPLVSFEAELAKKLGLTIGDLVTVNVLGRNVTARVANLREVNWESLAINFVMVFSPNTLKGAPHNLLATITLPRSVSLQTEAEVARALGKAYPAVTAIRVKDALNAFAAIYTKVMTAVRVAAGVTLAAGALVLAGALATAQRRRILEAVILKTIGATRRRVLTAHIAEYVGLALVTAVLAGLLGSLAAWAALTQVMDVHFTFSWPAVLQALFAAILLVVVFGAVGSWRVLSARAVPYLRSE